MDKYLQEDFEREHNKDQILIEEYKRDFEAKYWEWYEQSEGKVIIKNEDGTTTEIEELLPEYKLPF